MATFILILHLVTIFLLIITILIQSGKGAEISASFGGSSQTVFGTAGGGNFFTKFTGVLAAIFMITSLTLTLLGAKSKKSVFEGAAIPAAQSQPAAPQNTEAQPAQAPAQAPATK